MPSSMSSAAPGMRSPPSAFAASPAIPTWNRSRFRRVSMTLPPGAARELVVEFEPHPGVPLPAAGNLPQRQVGVGVGSLMACREDDLLARLDYLEAKALPLRRLG